ncbi:hypothetical protein DH2020_005343 [Rehmannia glutinosa]|uniref:Cytochrome P450 protein n=1 Tax=Rehmannia glutinosa TaxID=99300 RepID=A0ABR0XFN8_REHGL
MDLLVNSALPISALVLAISILWSLMELIKSNRKTPLLAPGPRGLPIVGYLPFLRKDLHHQFTELSHRHGPIFKLWLGNKLWIVISSPSLIKEVLRDQDAIFANRDITVAARIATYGLNDIGWSPYGPQWRNLRKIFAREMLSSANLKATYNLRKDEVRKAKILVNERMRNHSQNTLKNEERTDFLQILVDLMREEDNKASLGKVQLKALLLAWDNPSEFRPERFFGNNGKWDFSGNNFNYIPFGSGRRICAGLPLAEIMVRYILASLLHSFEWRLPDGEKLDMSDKLFMTLRKRIPLSAIPAPRLSISDLYE